MREKKLDQETCRVNKITEISYYITLLKVNFLVDLVRKHWLLFRQEITISSATFLTAFIDLVNNTL